MSHTLGPWHVDTNGGMGNSNVAFVVDGNPNHCSIANIRFSNYEHDAMANARLIAAAPEMYELLIKIGEKWNSEGDAKSRYAHEVRYLLDKIEGR